MTRRVRRNDGQASKAKVAQVPMKPMFDALVGKTSLPGLPPFLRGRVREGQQVTG
jgi:hypothetical protein